MPEDPLKVDLKTQLRQFRLRAKIALHTTLDDVEFNIMTSQETRETESLRAETFTGEITNFLREDISGKLKPLHLTGKQTEAFRFLMNSIEDGNLVLTRSHGVIRDDNPAVVKIYEAKIDHQFQKNSKGVTLGIVWRPEDNASQNFDLNGTVGYDLLPSVRFITFDQKPKKPEDVHGFFIPEGKGFTRQIGVYNNGERIVCNTQMSVEGKDVEKTENYYLIGSFDGEGTQRTYWVYGSNDETQQKRTEKESVKLGQTSAEKANG